MEVQIRSTRSPQDASDESTEQALLELIAGNVQRVPLAIAFLVLVVVSLCYTSESLWLLCLWGAVVLGMQYIRFLVLPALVSNRDSSGKKRLTQAAVLSLINGFIFASAIVFFPDLNDVSRSVFTVVFLGLAQASVTTAVGYRPIIIAFTGPFLMALTIAWMTTPFEISPWVPPAMAILICLYGAILLSMAGDIYDSFLRAHQIQFQLRDALASEKEANSAKTRFLAAASHDLRQPLHTLSLYGAALTQRPLDNKSAEIANSMNEALSDLATELDALLDISKLDAGTVHLDKELFDCCESIVRTVNTYQSICQQKGVTLECRFSLQPTMFNDRIQFERIVRNVLDNAVKYTPQGSILVSVMPLNEKHFQVVIEDTGTGISEDELEQVFLEFYQTDNPERERARGLGLGLAIVKRLTPMLDGTISLESVENEFTRVTLTFPMSGTVQQVSAPRKKRTHLAEHHVLIVDDDNAVRAATRALFEGIGCEVSEAADTQSALTSVQARQPDIALVDLRLPRGECGLKTVQKIHQTIVDLPVIIITGETSPAVLKLLNSSGLPYLSKPIDQSTLLGKIGKVLGSAPGSGFPQNGGWHA